MTATQLITDMNWEAYCDLKRMNASTIVAANKSMLRLKSAIAGGFPEETDAMRLGTGIHALLLEPDEFEERFAVVPDFHLDAANVTAGKNGKPTTSKNTNYYKERVRDFAKANTDKAFLTRAQYDIALHCIEAIRSRPYMAKIVDQCETEVTLLGEIGGVPFKGRVDMIREKRPLIVDLKTTADCSKHAFGWVFARLHYDQKLAIYRELARQYLGKTPDVAIITQEPSGEFDNAYVPIPGDVLDRAFSRVLFLVGKYIQARDSGHWPGVDGGNDRYELELKGLVDADEELIGFDDDDEAAVGSEYF